ncbi:MAG: PEP-CTERM sorting domain-containing protein [Azoarcus sp.]|jgi:hypothetical protein|nr:PEP-CTERM sorting domain-containing protein [Azoarcus sp.]
MKNKLWLFAVPALMAVSAVSAVEIDFSNQTYFDTSENGFNYLVPVDITVNPGVYAGTGYANVSAVTGATVFGTNVYEHNPFTFNYVGPGDSFKLDSFYFANAWGTQTVTFTGYKDGALVGTATYNTSTAATQYDLGWGAIDKFVITAADNFVPDPTLAGGGASWALGSVNVTAVTTVPEPESYAMLLAGLAIVGAVARRRRVASRA